MMFYWDKWCAENGRSRIPESNLLLVALIGGSVGAVAGQQVMRHKIRKEPFRTLLYGIVVFQVAGLLVGLSGAYHKL
ncbi:unnamed protein product [Phaeothamnion confervicola]